MQITVVGFMGENDSGKKFSIRQQRKKAELMKYGLSMSNTVLRSSFELVLD